MKKNKYSKFFPIFLGIVIGIMLYSNIHTFANDDLDLSFKCNTFPTSQIEIKKKKQNSTTLQEGRKYMQTFAVSPQKRFRIHYDTAGYNAVDKYDGNINGIPDWVDNVGIVFDEVYEIEIIQMEMNRPATNYYETNDSLYDIYIEELGKIHHIYGETSSYGSYFDSTSNYPKKYSNITVDNDYSPNDSYLNEKNQIVFVYSTTGIEALKVTAAHEFHHAIQFAYREPPGSNACIFEMSAVCMEMILYPEIQDYVQYVNALLTNFRKYHFGNGNANNGYSYGIFFYMLTQHYGKNIIKEYWKLVESGYYCYESIEKLLVSYNSSMAEEWKKFVKCLYYSGNNSIDEQYFPMAKDFKTPTPNSIYNEPDMDVIHLYPYELSFSRFLNGSNGKFIMPDSADLIFTNLNTKGMIEHEKSYLWESIECNALSSKSQLEEGFELFDSFWLRIFSISENMHYFLNTKLGGKTIAAIQCYPMPFNKQNDNYLCFPINDDVRIGDKLKLTIFDGQLNTILTETIISSVDNGKRVIKFNPDSLQSGIYSFSISRGDTDLVGKFVIK